VYLTSGVLRDDIEARPPEKGKPTEADVVAVWWLVVDLDPQAVPASWKGTAAAWVESQRRRILASLTTDLPKGVPRAVRRCQTWVSKCELGERRVDFVELEDLAAALGQKPLDWFRTRR